MSAEATRPGLSREVESHHVGGSCVIRVSGELDLVGGYDLRHAFLDALHRGSYAVLLDLSGVSAVDARGVSSLEWCSTRARDARRTLTWTACSQPLSRYLASHVRPREWNVRPAVLSSGGHSRTRTPLESRQGGPDAKRCDAGSCDAGFPDPR